MPVRERSCYPESCYAEEVHGRGLIELTLHHTHASGRLLPARFAQVFALVAKTSPAAPRGTIHGQELLLGVALHPEDGAAAGFPLEFLGQGARVKASARGPSAALLTWAMHALAAQVRGRLVDEADGAEVAAEPDRHRDAALAYLEVYEADVLATRRSRAEADGAGFVAWLAREELLEPAPAGALGTPLPLDDAAALYELLLESEAIEDVFVSERELTRLLERYRARAR